MADIFVSYSRQDRARVTPLVAALETHGWSVWWDPDISPGEEFDSLISRELEGAKSLIVVWTPQSVESRWVRGEARDAANRGVLVPVRFDNAKLPIDFRALHATDLDGWNEDRNDAAFLSLCKALESKLGMPKIVVPIAHKSAQVSICVLPFAKRSSQGMLSWIETDSDLDPIRPDPRYDAMIARARERLAKKLQTPLG